MQEVLCIASSSWPPSSSRWKTNRVYDWTPCSRSAAGACAAGARLALVLVLWPVVRLHASSSVRMHLGIPYLKRYQAKGCMHGRLAQMANQQHASHSPLSGTPGTRGSSLKGDGKDRGRAMGTGLQVL